MTLLARLFRRVRYFRGVPVNHSGRDLGNASCVLTRRSIYVLHTHTATLTATYAFHYTDCVWGGGWQHFHVTRFETWAASALRLYLKSTPGKDHGIWSGDM